MKKIRTVIIVFIVLVLFGGAALLVLRPVNTEEQAINIAQFYMRALFGNIFSGYKMGAYSYEDEWVVGYYIETDGYIDPGGGLPVIHILKQNGLPVFLGRGC